jgi:protein-L-isoaspartate O-methyltransferase
MIDLLDLQPGKKVLEIGTGSGYQTALLAELAYIEIFSIEIIRNYINSLQHFCMCLATKISIKNWRWIFRMVRICTV